MTTAIDCLGDEQTRNMRQRTLVESVTEEVFALSDLPSKKALIVLISTVREIAARHSREIGRITPRKLHSL